MATLLRLPFSVSHDPGSVCLGLCPPLLGEGLGTPWAGLLGLGGGLKRGAGERGGGKGEAEGRGEDGESAWRGRVCEGGGEEGLGALWPG